MVNFPSLLVSEEDEAAALANPGGSTVHSWINADFVPSWLRPFTLDQNTRFTRTPDHLLRPPEEPQPEDLPSYGTTGASWHFLEMPLDREEDAPPLPSVRADIEALEQAFSDLPALRATRESTQAQAGEDVSAEATIVAEGWSVDERGVETVLSWHDPVPSEAWPQPGEDGEGPDAMTGDRAGAPGVAAEAPVMVPFDAMPDVASSAAFPTAFEAAAGGDGLAPAFGAALPVLDGSSTGDWSVENTQAPMASDAPTLPQDAAEPMAGPSAWASFAPAWADGGAASAVDMPNLAPVAADSTLGEVAIAGRLDGDVFNADASGVDLPGADLPGADMSGADVAPFGPVATIEPAASQPLDASAMAVGAAPAADAAVGRADAMAGEDFATDLAVDLDGAPEDLDLTAMPLDGAPFDGTLAQLTAAALDGASALLEADTPMDECAVDAPAGPAAALPADPVPADPLPADTVAADVVPVETALAEADFAETDITEAALTDTALAEPEPSASPAEDHAPAHLRPLTRLIVVGRLALPVVREQDLLPPEPVAPAPEAETAARAASLIRAHFAWQPYHLHINAGPGAALDAGAAVPDPDAIAAPEPAAVPDPAPVVVAGLPAVVESAAAHDAFGYHLPPIDLLREPPQLEPDYELSEEFLDQSSAMLQQILRDFGIRGEVIDANPGPVVTLYEFEPAPGVKSSRVIALAADIARSMSAVSVRVAVVEGRNVIGIELPNRRRETVWLRELLAAHEFDEARAKLGFCLGKTIGGAPVIADLARMPHLLVAGTTGSGKSVAINTMILSLLYRHTPEACRLIMIDPKMLELSVYEGIPHLLTPVVTDPKKAIIALKWAVKEMEDRYRKMARLAVRNIDGYNARMAEAREKGEVITRQVQVGFDKESGEALYEEQQMDLSALPYIVIIVDEMADLMMVAGKEIEGAIQRLAQMARAAGIHLVMATQRPSVDVITGTIKANFPTRISFQVTSKIDSRTILGEMGAETLLGQGDMLFMAGGGRITRVHGPFVSDQEVEHVVAFLKAQGGPEYLEDVVQDEEADGASSDDAVFDKGELGESGGDLYEQAVAIVLRDRKASTSYIQRRLQVGYNKAASLMERMENEGIVGAANHAGKREILSFGRDRDDER